jgi:hypothetical protein
MMVKTTEISTTLGDRTAIIQPSVRVMTITTNKNEKGFRYTPDTILWAFRYVTPHILVDGALYYKPEGRGVRSPMRSLDFFN